MWPTIISCAVTLAIAAFGVAIAWGRLNKGQEDVSATLKVMTEEFRKLPEVYVSADMDKQRQKWLDERDAATKELLTDIKQELKEIRRQRP